MPCEKRAFNYREFELGDDTTETCLKRLENGGYE